MIGYDDALFALLQQARRLDAVSCATADALGKVLAADVVSPMDLPSFDHSAMDGYALHAGQTLAAGTEHAVHGSQAAGDASRTSQGMAWEIMTGARLPEGLDSGARGKWNSTGILSEWENGSRSSGRMS